MPGIEKEINPENKKTFYATMLFLGSEAIFFTCLIAAYVFYAGASPDGPNAHRVLDPWKTGLYTMCLLSSSISVFLAERAHRKGKSGVGMWLGVTMLLGAIFLYGEMQEYRKLLHENVTVSRNLFGSTYFTLTGFHAIHVTAGIILLGIMFTISVSRSIGRPQSVALTCISYYWHFVDVVWVAVFSVVYLWSAH
ncbi:MAG: heme-copper oxidase subunit III [Candidatus Sulfotelmatobacter sp.]